MQKEKEHNNIYKSEAKNYLSLPAGYLSGAEKSVTGVPFCAYREKYYENSKFFNKKVEYESFIKHTGDKLESFVKQHKIETIIYGISGDLDSSFVLVVLAQIINERSLNCGIVAFNFKRIFQPKRVARIQKLLRYVSSRFLPVTFLSYDISASSNLLAAEIKIFESKKIRPKNIEQIREFNLVLDELKGFPASGQSLSKIPQRENAPLLHEISTAIRGRLLRSFPNSMLVSSTNASEICVSNFTTTDLLTSFSPLAFCQKTDVVNLFKDVIDRSLGGLNLKDWEFSIACPTPFHPSKLSYEFIDESRLHFKRESKHYKFLDDVVLNIKESKAGDVFWRSFQGNLGFFPIHGAAQYLSDEYTNYFLLDGLSENTINELIKKFPGSKSDILFSAIIYLSARELTVKDMYVDKMLG